MSIVFSDPLFILGGTALAVLMLGAIIILRRGVTLDCVRAALVIILLSAALAGPGSLEKLVQEPGSFTAIVDVSKSAVGRADIRELVNALPINTRCIAMGETSGVLDCAQLASNALKFMGEKTDLSKALAIAGGDTLLITDGAENLGSAELFINNDPTKVRLHPVILSAEANTAHIAQVTYPPFIRALQKISIGVALDGLPTARGSDTLKLVIKRSSDANGSVTKQVPNLAFATRFDFDFEPADKFNGLEEFTVELSDKNLNILDSRVILVGSNTEKTVLVISSQQALSVALSDTLREQGFTVLQSRDGNVENSAADFSTIKAVILINTARSELASGLEVRIEKYVQGGGVFVMTGGPKSFAAGGYKNSILGEILPVNLLPPETVVARLSVAVGLVLDKSGSMAQAEKLEGAKGAAREVVQNLKDEDTIAVIGFDDAPFVVLRASPVGQVRDIAAERIGRLFPAGRTNLIPALDEARRMLSKVEAGRKHVIVMTDGRLPDEGEFYFELLRQMRLAGITVSTVLLGGENDFSFLKQMAEIGGGGFYQTSDPRLLPRIFLQDIKVSVNAPTPPRDFTVREVTPVAVSLGEYPNLLGVSPSTIKAGASLELAAFASPDSSALEKKPLLASWVKGNGRSVAFLVDIFGQQAPGWIRWSKLGEFWRQVISADGTFAATNPQSRQRRLGGASGIARNEPTLEFGIEQRGEYTALNVTIYDAPLKGVLDWRIQNSAGANVLERVTEPQAGRYRVLVHTASAGNYTVHAADWLPQFGFAVRKADLADTSGETTVDNVYLQRLANMTGGNTLQARDIPAFAKKLVLKNNAAEQKRSDLTWLLVALAFGVQLIGMLLRRES